MAKSKKKTKYRYVKRYKKGKRKRKTVPMEVLIAAGSHFVIPAFPSYPSNSPMTALSQGDFQEFLKQEAMGWTGIDISNPSDINVGQMINPFDFNRGIYWKVMLWSGVASKIRKKLVPQASLLFRKIPWIGRWVS